MRRNKMIRKALLGLSVILAGGTAFDNGCINALASIPVCGTVLTFCTAQDQLNLLYPLLDLPNYEWDNSCTVPLGCTGSDIYDPVVDGTGTPGGGASPQPSESTSGTTGGGGV